MANSITSAGLWFPALFGGNMPASPAPSFSTHTITVSNAVAFMGHLFLDGRPTSKLLSAAGGGQISFRTGGVSAWTALSTLGIGIQDMDNATGAPARPDLAYDVSISITSSTVTLTSNHWHTFTMTSGAKTLSHGQIYAFVVRMGTRVSNDAASVAGISAFAVGRQLPMGATLSAGTAWAATSTIPNVLFKCDDGTLGWFMHGYAVSSITAVSVSAAAANTEQGMRFVSPWTCEIDALSALIVGGTTAGNPILRLYADPNGTPTTLTAIAVSGLHQPSGINTNINVFPLEAPITLSASTTYLMSLGDGGTFGINCYEFADAANKITYPGGTTMARGARAGGAGAFSMVETNIPAGMGVRISSISQGGGASTVTVTTTTTITTTLGSILVHPGMTGGMNG